MAAAMVLYVLISQVGLIVGNQIASTAAASGPAIYNYTWLVLMLPFGMIGVTVLTVVMPRLSRNAAADDTPAVLADLSLATRLTMVTLIPDRRVHDRRRARRSAARCSPTATSATSTPAIWAWRSRCRRSR